MTMGMRMRYHGTTLILALFLAAACAIPSSARFRARFGFGWGGPRTHVVIGGPWWPYWDDPYYYDYPYAYAPYYDPYYYYRPPPPYYAAPPASPPAVAYSSDNPPGASAPAATIESVRTEIAHRRAYANYRYDDGDISRDERDAELRRLDDIQKRADARAQSGGLTTEEAQGFLDEIAGRQAKESPATEAKPVPVTAPTANPYAHRELTPIDDLLLELRTLLDEKLKEGEITKAQHTAEGRRLDAIERQANASKKSHGGILPRDEQAALTIQLHQAYYDISHNFIGN